MLDMFPFPRIKEGQPEEQIADIINYLIQFKETLEFALMNISTENLSPDLITKLNELGADIEKSNTAREEEVAQVSVKSLTIPDVCNSDLFKDAVRSEASRYISFNVNFNTGHLEYNVSNEEVNNG